MVKLVGFVLSPSEHPIYLLKNLVGRFSPLYYIVRTQAKIADVVTNKLVFSKFTLVFLASLKYISYFCSVRPRRPC